MPLEELYPTYPWGLFRREAARRFILQKEPSNEDRELIHLHCAGTTFFKGFLLATYCCMWSLEEWRDSCKVCTSAGGGQPKYSICQAWGPTQSSLAQMLPLPIDNERYQLLSCWPCLRPQWSRDGICSLDGVGTRPPCSVAPTRWCECQTQVDGVLVPIFSKNKRLVEFYRFYLSQVVFPHAAWEFSFKLPSPDICLGSGGRQEESHNRLYWHK